MTDDVECGCGGIGFCRCNAGMARASEFSERLARLGMLEAAIEKMVPLHEVEELAQEIATLKHGISRLLTRFQARLAIVPRLAAIHDQASCSSDLCGTCQHPAKNHISGRCRKRRCGCGRFVAQPPPAGSTLP